MLYRDLHHAAHRMDAIHAPLRQAILANSTQEMTDGAEEAEKAADQLLRLLQTALQDSTDALEVQTDEGSSELFFVHAAVNALQRTVSKTEQSLRGTDVSSVRAGLLDCKTQADFADAYLRAAIGDEET